MHERRNLSCKFHTQRVHFTSTFYSSHFSIQKCDDINTRTIEIPQCARFINVNYCRPQRSWGKVIFSEAYLKNSVHRGEGVCPIACWDTPPWDQTPPPSTVHAERHRQQAGGTHPTGIQSCCFEVQNAHFKLAWPSL